jgi:hypothetical protein
MLDQRNKRKKKDSEKSQKEQDVDKEYSLREKTGKESVVTY